MQDDKKDKKDEEDEEEEKEDETPKGVSFDEGYFPSTVM